MKISVVSSILTRSPKRPHTHKRLLDWFKILMLSSKCVKKDWEAADNCFLSPNHEIILPLCAGTRCTVILENIVGGSLKSLNQLPLFSRIKTEDNGIGASDFRKLKGRYSL